MRDILDTLDQWLEQGEEIALATLVDTHGPSPRPSGARLILTRSGRMEGSVSGGCVENDVFERGQRVLQEGTSVLQRYGIDDEQSVAVGLSCGGEIDVLIEPFRPDPAWTHVRQSIETRTPAALCIALEPDALRGGRLAIDAEGQRIGGIDAGLDDAIAEAASALLQDGGRTLLHLPWQGESRRIFIEAQVPPARLFIVGATHTAIPLCSMAKRNGYHVSVVDPSTPVATEARFPEADEILREWPNEVLDAAGLDARSYVLTLTHDIKFDIPTLASALRSEARYIGALGSRRTHARRLERLRDEGFSEDAFSRIHTPIGLDIGARSPEEIALAILAEIVAVRNRRDGGPLAQRSGPIHTDEIAN
jgi:xanthine dehydrogenase accessory factor